jgi:histone deacetylase complex regulatory component SIN3
MSLVYIAVLLTVFSVFRMTPVDSYDRIKALFVDYADLIEGFQCFLPPSLRPTPVVKAIVLTKVQQSAGQADSSNSEPGHTALVNKRQLKAKNPNAIELPPPLSQAQKLEHAVSFINNIKVCC